jgi:hypothetical protein
MFDLNEYPKVKIIALGTKGKDIVTEILVDIPSLNCLIIEDDSNVIDEEKEYKLNDFLSDTNVLFVVGSINDNTAHILNMLEDFVYIDIFPLVMLIADSKNNNIESLKSIIPNTIIVENYESIVIYKSLINILISTCSLSKVSRYSTLIDTNIYEFKNAISCGKKHHIGYGVGIGVERARDSVLMATNNLISKINISEVKSILFLFNVPENFALFEVEDSIKMFIEKYNYTNDYLYMCVYDNQMQRDELEVTIITISD